MAHLASHLAAPAARPVVVTDACALIDREVARTSGVSGLAIRAAYRIVTAVRPGIVASAVDGLLVPFADRLDPFYQEHLTTGRPMAQVLTSQRASMADALLAVADDRAERSSNEVVRRTYERVRGSARRHVEAAAPGIAALIQAHAPDGRSPDRVDDPDR